MTRINTIDPSPLLDEHLIAEWREMPRIVNELRKNPQIFVKDDIPSEYTLNKGHVKFFRDKLVYLKNRHESLCIEMDLRGINRNPEVRIDFEGLDDSILLEAMNDWTPTKRDHYINFKRIKERFAYRKRAYKFKGTVIDDYNSWANYENLVNDSINDEFDDNGCEDHFTNINCRCSVVYIDSVSIRDLVGLVKKHSSFVPFSSDRTYHRFKSESIVMFSGSFRINDYRALCIDIVGDKDCPVTEVIEMIVCMEYCGFDVALDTYGGEFLCLMASL